MYDSMSAVVASVSQSGRSIASIVRIDGDDNKGIGLSCRISGDGILRTGLELDSCDGCRRSTGGKGDGERRLISLITESSVKV